MEINVMPDNRTGQRIQTIMLGPLFGLFLLLRFRKWLRRPVGGGSRQSSV
jgi:hypothetical protein